MTFNFDNSKKIALSKKDKSSINEVDVKIKNLCDKINNNKNYFTTSSCSGRIVLIKDEDKKKPGLFLFRSHEKIYLKDLKNELEKNKTKYIGTIMFKQEPCLLVVSCRDKESQWKLFNIARNNGWKKSGILSINKKFLIELMSTENISSPIIDNGRILVNDDFLRVVIKKSNENLEKSWEKIYRLEELVEKIFK